MSKRFNTYGGVIKWDHINEQIIQIKCLNPPTFNARFVSKIKTEYPNYTFIEEWKDASNTTR